MWTCCLAYNVTHYSMNLCYPCKTLHNATFVKKKSYYIFTIAHFVYVMEFVIVSSDI